MDAVLFDMDGLLVDTEKVWFEVETEVVERLGGSWGPEHGAALVGGSWDRTVAYMLDLTGSGTAPEEVARWLLDGMVERLLVEVEPMPGALELLSELNEAGVVTGLVTSSLKPVADAVLDVVGRHRFTVVVTADDVTRTKPDPEPYLTACRVLGVRPERCVVLEDSPNGVAAGTAAGCRVVAVPSVVPIPAAPGRLVVPSLIEVDLKVLRALFQEF
ncbi:haloacid dehalogenase [Acrocarpospora phusangensis]|uniref:Haloacid dehalogenase n=1 Tax=Acrocarpospora phusangensis TaxID=1070424 RepID=A0A919QEF9_9ACTN|nr:HAD family phosphatase [Acrocarpospora phusangensis]GIH24762.1 haloacid dehalogenase [Acrocarpospora phusangensis]